MFAGMAASFTMVVSGTIVNVAVPSVIGAFGIGLDQAQLITTGFNIAMVTSQLLSAWLVAAFGQRLGFLLMAAVFRLAASSAAWAKPSTWSSLGASCRGWRPVLFSRW